MLDLARPHLVQAYRNAVLRGRAAAVTGALSDTLERLGDPAAILDDEGRVTFATPEAKELLRELGGTVGAPLPPGLRGADAQLEPFVVERGGAPLFVRPLRLTRAGQHVLLFESDGHVDRVALLGFGLTPRESEVLAAFAAGQAPGEIAHELRISVRTVHKHTQRIHAKLGTRDRAQAVATAYAAIRTNA